MCFTLWPREILLVWKYDIRISEGHVAWSTSKNYGWQLPRRCKRVEGSLARGLFNFVIYSSCSRTNLFCSVCENGTWDLRAWEFSLSALSLQNGEISEILQFSPFFILIFFFGSSICMDLLFVDSSRFQQDPYISAVIEAVVHEAHKHGRDGIWNRRRITYSLSITSLPVSLGSEAPYDFVAYPMIQSGNWTPSNLP